MNSEVGKSKTEKGCCGPAPCCTPDREKEQEEKKERKTQVVTRVSTQLTRADKWAHIKARWGIKRMSYIIEPGIYAVGNPDESSIVLVSANYKLSFDALRKELTGLDAWILVLDTKGINVWCAAGKGTFGTDELVRRIEVTGLKDIVNHRKVIAPQLGAPGIAAHQVRKRSGFSVIYGPVRASDIPAYLQAGMKTTTEMRRVRFPFGDRMRVVPVELVQGLRTLLMIMAVFFLLSGFSGSGYSIDTAVTSGIRAVLSLLLAYIAGTVAGPLLLPWLPGRSFSMKGLETGVLFFGLSFFIIFPGISLVEVAAWFLMMTALSSFLTMNFTGASTYTSLSGVKKEMRFAVPVQAAAAVVGSLLWIAGRFV
ncbi:MAG: acetyl-CoA synthase subunit gamma [bacterium]|nr:acetyl-CoA synthase subunit gamma [bacterium]